ncbi:hypothetical protein SBOR_10028 [Sclerotinia borealis F-4128]|uniref:Reverse transcriptase domain-containing protein n=1 Tax=Sclerotinia borealis (strain F-4128) TaxID=1432307 RepID=W9BYB3_SCLBF|nr:hypothetical protein SBOR_10028 [Sclerotinia borealis F-4128]
MASLTAPPEVVDLENADFTKTRDPETPSNLQNRSKRRQRTFTNEVPPVLQLGSKANTNNTSPAMIQRKVMTGLVEAIDRYVNFFAAGDERTAARKLSTRVVEILTLSINDGSDRASTASYTPPATRSSASLKTQTTTKTYAGILKTPKTSQNGAGREDPLTHQEAPPKAPHDSARAKQRATRTARSTDHRLLIAISPAARISRPAPYALRSALVGAISGLTLADVPTISATKTGWAITPKNPATQELLLTQENKEIILRISRGTQVHQSVTWYNYAVPGVPASIRTLDGLPADTASHVEAEVQAQTGQTPVSCRPSRHGANPHNGTITWVVSFLEPVRGFRLFNASELAREIKAKPTITRHDTGCQGWCNPTRCTRLTRCANCGARKDTHEGPQGPNCTAKARCANCFGPFAAGHPNCPAAPKVVDGKVTAPTKPQLKAIRKPALAMEAAMLASQKDKDKESPIQGPTLATVTPELTTTPTLRKRPGAQITAYETSREGPTAAQLKRDSAVATTAQTEPDRVAGLLKRSTAASSRSRRRPSLKTRLNEEALASTQQDIEMGEDPQPSAHEIRDLTVCWANVGRIPEAHDTILQMAFEDKTDVLCVQEPSTFPLTKTKTHPGWTLYAPVDSWTGTSPEQREAERPRVLTQPRTEQVLTYVIELQPPPGCLIGGDFNAIHETWQPGTENQRGGNELAAWADLAELEFIGERGAPTHTGGNVLDLTFSNIPFTETRVRHDLHNESDHHTLITTIPGRGIKPLNQHNICVPETELPRLAGLVANGVAYLPTNDTLDTPGKIDDFADQITQVIKQAITAVRTTDKGKGKAAPWWTTECKRTYTKHLSRQAIPGNPPTTTTKDFKTTVRAAKRNYWRHVIDDISSDKDLYKIWEGNGHLPWNSRLTLEEVEASVIGVSSTSPGTDQVTKCLKHSHFPKTWKLAEVAMLPKIGKKDMTSARSWRPIALLSCIGKGLERIVTKQLGWTALRHGIINPQHSKALPKRSAMDLVASFTHDVETALGAGKKVTMVTMDVQGAFDTLLKRRLLTKITKQGWPKDLLLLIDSFLTERKNPPGLPLITSPVHAVPGGATLTRHLPQVRKLEMIHISMDNGNAAPAIRVNEELTIHPIVATETNTRPALRWLGGSDKAYPRPGQSYARPPAHAMRKAVTTCVLPSLLYGTEAWYGGRFKAARRLKTGQTKVSARLGWHVTQIEKVLTVAIRGVIPAWKTTPVTALYCETGLPSAMAALEEAKLRFALRLQSVDATHPLTKRIEPPIIIKRRDTGTRQRTKTKVQRLGLLVPPIPKPTLKPPRYTTSYRIDPTEGIDKKTAAKAFNTWQEPDTGGLRFHQHPVTHLRRGSHRSMERPGAHPQGRQTFNNCHKTMKDYDIRVKWSPGHESIEGNEVANHLADLGAKKPSWDTGPASQPTYSGVRSIARILKEKARQEWWTACKPALSLWYKQWDPVYKVKPLPKLLLPRVVLYKLITIRTSHGDFGWYHRKFGYTGDTECSCGRPKTPAHLVHCRKARDTFEQWPNKPPKLPSTNKEGIEYLRQVLSNPADFAKLLKLTKFYEDIYPKTDSQCTIQTKPQTPSAECMQRNNNSNSNGKPTAKAHPPTPDKTAGPPQLAEERMYKLEGNTRLPGMALRTSAYP